MSIRTKIPGMLFFVLIAIIDLPAQKSAGLALAPPMGWNSWNAFGSEIHEEIIKTAADVLVESGMRDVGYQYVVIDDGWQGQRDSLGFIQPDPTRFPSGMKALADYVHARGLKFGLYSDAGSKTCAGFPGSRGHEYQDAMQYAAWGVDYLKYDWCYTEHLNARGAYTTMRDALYATNRSILFSICEWGENKPWVWGRSTGHLWRISADMAPAFSSAVEHSTWKAASVLSIIDINESLRKYAGPDQWNDPDMLQVGNGMSVNEDRAHFSMWCMLAAPLMAGTDLTNMTPETLNILTNAEAIAINQDSLGVQALKYSSQDSVDIWFKPLANGEWAVCFLNRDVVAKDIHFTWSDHVVVDDVTDRKLNFSKQEFQFRDVWSKKNLGTTGASLRHTVQGHDVLMLRLH